MKFSGRCLFVALTAALVQGQSPTINDVPTREFGHPRLQFPPASSAPNLVEGRELWQPQSIALDTSVSPPAVYVADTGNNRVLAWRSSANLTKGDFADKVIGQRDMQSTGRLGPGTTLSAGLSAPTAVLVDPRNGSLYVADAGNNRILRFPNPFNQTGSLLVTDLVIGQASVSSGSLPNQGGSPGPATLALSQGNTPFVAAMAFDSQLNLWVTDAANNRVLRFPAAKLLAGTSAPEADRVLGEGDFITNVRQSCTLPNANPITGQQQPNKDFLLQPTSLAFDGQNRLYVADSCSRVLYYRDPANQRSADHVLGFIIADPATGRPHPYPNEYSLGVPDPNGNFSTASAPQGVFTIGNNLFVCDTTANRIVRYDPLDNFIEPTQRPTSWDNAQVSPRIAAVALGQQDLLSGKPNRARAEPDATTLHFPVAATTPNPGAFSGELWVADAGNNRVVVFPFVPTANFQPATRVLGQIDFPYRSRNLIEGREVDFSPSLLPGAGLAIDKNSSPPHLYIADSQNNRVLAFRDARTVSQGSRADLVIGQPDLFRSVINYPSNDPTKPTDTGLFNPTDVAVDGNGSLLVADAGNGRVVRFPAPFSQPAGVPVHASLVLGQPTLFSAPLPNPGPDYMGNPFGLVLFSDGSLAVSDVLFNRVLILKRKGADFTNFQTADVVLGQADFFSINPASPQNPLTNQLTRPTHMATDTSDRLYVCDTGDNRVLVFPRAAGLINNQSASAAIPGVGQPQGVAVSAATGEIWITNTSGNQIGRFPVFETLVQSPTPNFNLATAVLAAPAALAITLDASDNLIVAEGGNRITFYYAKLAFRNAASYNQQPLAPGMLAVLGQLGKDFALTPASAPGLPLPFTLSDVQVSVGGIPAPIFRVDPSVINFQVPMTAPSAGNPEFQVRRVSTGEILAVASLPMGLANPAFFTASATGVGPVAATNQDGTVNSATNPAGRGTIVSFYLTGQGSVPGAPPDGALPSGPVSTSVLPRITMVPGPAGFINQLCSQPPSMQDQLGGCIQYSGLAGYFPGVWQINLLVPMQVLPSSNVVVALTFNDVPSNIGPSGPSVKILTLFSVK
jgi:uncharacterized protein (TIGR03437 family)